jgi:predicted regulator of amino acid metabolism with ACT domain
MWNKIRHYFEESPSKLKVARLLVETGLRVDDRGRTYCGEIEVPATKLAAAAGVDRRVVKETAKAILEIDELRKLFIGLRPAGPLMREVAPYLGYGVVEIRAKPSTVGIIAKVATLIADEGISIRQILAEDPEINPDPKLIVVTEKPIPGEILQELLKIPTVSKVSIS